MMAKRRVKSDFLAQDYDEIQAGLILLRGSREELAEDELFTDPTFPPDATSLTYVYSGDDTYEKIVFHRPKDLSVSPTFCGIGGVCDFRVQWKHLIDKLWIQMALSVISVNSVFLERLLPGYRVHEQSFVDNYTGVFQVHVWRFGQWREVVVDDWLPVSAGRLAFCSAMGSPPEFWGTLVEKAYAKCHKAYEAIEVGLALDALTDFTGNVCEFFAVDNSPDSHLYHILLKSFMNQSHIACWPRTANLTRTGIPGADETNGEKEPVDKSKHTETFSHGKQRHGCWQHIITSVTKFPLKDGGVACMIRLKDPYCNGTPCWSGEFSRRGKKWNTVHKRFMDSFRPLHCLDSYEYWISYDEFCSSFSMIVICSSPDGVTYTDFGAERIYRTQSEDTFTNLNQESDGEANGFLGIQEKSETVNPIYRYECLRKAPVSDGIRREIVVCESPQTVKMDTVSSDWNVSSSTTESSPTSSHLDMRQTSPFDHIFSNELSSIHNKFAFVTEKQSAQKRHASDSFDSPLHILEGFDRNQQGLLSQFEQDVNLFTGNEVWEGDVTLSLASSVRSSLSEVSQASVSSDHKNCSKGRKSAKNFSARHVQYLEEDPAPVKISRERHSSASTVIFESRMDYFRPRGKWRELLVTYGRWKKGTSGGPRSDMARHSTNPRLFFTVTKADTLSELCSVSYHGKSHVLISLLQDYRLNSVQGTNIIKTIGFSVYKVKNIDRDRKRHLSKLCHVMDRLSAPECREATARVDLLPGMYALVPFTKETGKEGEFLVRILCQHDTEGSKQACVLS